MYHMAEPEEDSKLFHLDEGEEEDDGYTVDYFGRVLRIEEFSLCDSDSDCISACEESACDGQQQEGDDPVMSWWMSEESAIRAVQKVENVYLEDHLRIEAILDSVQMSVSYLCTWLQEELLAARRTTLDFRMHKETKSLVLESRWLA